MDIIDNYEVCHLKQGDIIPHVDLNKDVISICEMLNLIDLPMGIINRTYEVTIYYKNKIIQSISDQPAIIFKRVDDPRQCKIWSNNGIIHRDSSDSAGNKLPALITMHGSKAYFINGNRINRIIE